ncbi:MAG: sulfatase-like hydrolase/transferase [Pseudomonadota bacterium]
MRLSLAAITTLLFQTASASIAAAQPNVLLIIADDMGLDASRCYEVGDQQAPMPTLESLCARGMVFDNAYAAPVCSPTRATIMTGQYGFRTGVGSTVSSNGTNGLDEDVTSLFDLMNAADYASALIGKWHLADSGDDLNHPADFGVPYYFGLFSGALQDYENWTAVENGREVQVNRYATTEMTDRAIDWIAGQDDPWFLWLAYNAPHDPFHLPPLNLHDFDDLRDDADAIAADPLPYYNATLQALDTEIGRLLASLPAEERAETVILFVGDNGSPNEVVGDIYGDKGAKQTIYEGGTNVPLIVAGPDVAAGQTNALVNTTDLFATVAGYAGIGTDTPDAFDIRPVLGGGRNARDFAYVEYFSDQSRGGRNAVFGWALRDGPFKLVVPDGGTQELYDLSNDPQEQRDLLSDGVTMAERWRVMQMSARRDALVGD